MRAEGGGMRDEGVPVSSLRPHPSALVLNPLVTLWKKHGDETAGVAVVKQPVSTSAGTLHFQRKGSSPCRNSQNTLNCLRGEPGCYVIPCRREGCVGGLVKQLHFAVPSARRIPCLCPR